MSLDGEVASVQIPGMLHVGTFVSFLSFSNDNFSCDLLVVQVEDCSLFPFQLP